MKTTLIALSCIGFILGQSNKPTPDELYSDYKPDFEITGNYLRAYDVALLAHQKYMKKEKGITIANYVVLLQEDKHFYRVHFVPRDTPGKPPLPIGGGLGGRIEMLYAVDKKTYKILQQAHGG